jgi:hypothetical protein
MTLHDLSDVMPAKLDMTVPPGFRRMATIPDVLRLHHAKLNQREIQTIDGVRMTTPLRTLIDIIGEGRRRDGVDLHRPRRQVAFDRSMISETRLALHILVAAPHLLRHGEGQAA